MTTTNHRETARRIIFATAGSLGCELSNRLINALTKRFGTALTSLEADAYARGRAEAKAEDATIARNIYGVHLSETNREIADRIADAILASSPGPAIESRMRAEIAEKVKALQTHESPNGVLTLVDRDDVLAAIEGSGK